MHSGNPREHGTSKECQYKVGEEKKAWRSAICGCLYRSSLKQSLEQQPQEASSPSPCKPDSLVVIASTVLLRLQPLYFCCTFTLEDRGSDFTYLLKRTERLSQICLTWNSCRSFAVSMWCKAAPQHEPQPYYSDEANSCTVPYKLLFSKKCFACISNPAFTAHCYAMGRAGPRESLKCLAGGAAKASRPDCWSEACKSFLGMAWLQRWVMILNPTPLKELDSWLPWLTKPPFIWRFWVSLEISR